MGIPTEKEWKEALAKRQGRALLEGFQKASVAVCGLGGLGSCIALCLARAGIGRLILIDYDRVELSNLHRQQYKPGQIGLLKTEALAENLKEINPYIRLETVTERITEENFSEILKNAQIICEARSGGKSHACKRCFGKNAGKISDRSFRNGRNGFRKQHLHQKGDGAFLPVRRRKK